jgi:hypothetical protein
LAHRRGLGPAGRNCATTGVLQVLGGPARALPGAIQVPAQGGNSEQPAGREGHCMCPQCECAVKGAPDQRVEVPPEEEVDPLGSYLAGTRGDPRTRSPETEGLERRSSKLAGRNVSEARAGPERAIVEADLAHIQGRPRVRREGRRSVAGRSTGVVGAACRYTVRCATREAWSKRDGDPNTPSRAWRRPGVGGAYST